MAMPLPAFIRNIAVVAIACLAAAAIAADVHLSPHGDDAGDGSMERPVASLRRALDRAHEIRKDDEARATPIEIAVADGRYELAPPERCHLRRPYPRCV